jgi:hypothetical protein
MCVQEQVYDFCWKKFSFQIKKVVGLILSVVRVIAAE